MEKNIILLLITVLFIWSCSDIQEWGDPQDTIPPQGIINPKVENLPGGARITYQLPNDSDILGVKASYFPKGDQRNEIFTSAYTDTINIFGLPNTDERIVNLITVDKSKNESEPVMVKIYPLTPPVELIKNSFLVKPTFGGVYVEWENVMNTEISISIYTADSTGKMNMNEAHYSKLTKSGYSFRGYDDTPRKFQFEIRDRWGNFVFTDTVVTPLFEVEILPKDEYGQLLWKLHGENDGAWSWQGSLNDNKWTKAVDGITLSRTDYWDGRTENVLNRFLPGSPPSIGLRPMYMILDLGENITLSRHKIWMRGRNPGEDYLRSDHRYYQQGAPKYYEIWGSLNPPKQPSDFATIEESLAYWTEWTEVEGMDTWKNDWIKLFDCATLPLSGAKNAGQLTVDDIIYADEGIESQVPMNLSGEKVRYVRFVFKECWDPNRITLQIGEIKFYGAYSN